MKLKSRWSSLRIIRRDSIAWRDGLSIVASYLCGFDAYTFRFLGGEYQKEKLEIAEYYANYYGLNLHYVDIR